MWHEDVRGATEPADQTAFPFNLLAMPMVDEVRMKATDSLFDMSMAREHLWIMASTGRRACLFWVFDML